MLSDSESSQRKVRSILRKSNRQTNATLIVASVGLLALLGVSFTLPFNKGLFSMLFNKPSSNAAPISSAVLSVDATQDIHPFTSKNLGVAFVNWEFSWGAPYPNQIPGLAQALKAAHVGLIRYAGGLWANWVGFDPTQKAPNPNVNWTHNGMTYSFNYGTDELDSLQQLAQAAGADIMAQVNISNDDPSMWAQMVQYTNAPGKYPIKYWEMGNELDLEQTQAPDVYVNPTDYGNRMVGYQRAMSAVDPNIKFIGAAQATAVPQTGTNSALSDYFFIPLQETKAAGKVMDGVTYHWYQECNTNSLDDVLRYRWYNSDGTPIDPTVWNNSYSRYWGSYIPGAVKNQVISQYPGLLQGISELNVDACNYDNVYNGNHINALWFSDELGRLAYNGLDFATMYEGYGGQGYSLLYPSSDKSRIYARPPYYAYLMYAKYFGDQMIQSQSSDDGNISIWASKDSKDPGKLKLRITNVTASPINAPIDINGFSANSGYVYTLESSNPTDTSASSSTADALTFINGSKIDAMNVDASVAAIPPNYLSVNGSSFNYTFPAYSSTAIILNSTSQSPLPSPSGTPSPLPSPTPTLPPVNYTITGSVSPSTVLVGGSVNLTANVQASGQASALVDTEVYDAAGNKVFQNFTDNQSFTANQTQTYQSSWDTTGVTPGTYTLEAGVFKTGWAGLILWNANVATITVTAASPAPTLTPTPTPTPTPRITPSPTPTLTPSPSATPFVEGDFTNDGHVGLADLSIFAASYLTVAPNIPNPLCDLDHNNIVNLADLSLFSANYGK